MDKSRSQYTAKNILFGYIGNVVTAILGFVLRTVFIYKLGKTLLGVNGLYTSILTVLSLADLGLGTAMNYILYELVSKKDIPKIKVYMEFYKKAYRVIALVVAVIGISLIPFLQYIIKDPGDITLGKLRLYYVIFLFNIVSSYFVAYKYSLTNAEQKNYIQTNVITLTKLATVTIQIVVLLLDAGFTTFLLVQLVVETVQKVFVSIYLDKLYPFLREKVDDSLSDTEKKSIIKSVKALLMHKLGDMARLQTDNIIISAFISIGVVGMVDNYVLVVTSISAFVNIIFNSVISSLGNLVATESKEKQYQVFKTYRFLAAWIYGFSAVGYYVLLTPLVTMLWGADFALTAGVVGLYLVEYYFKGYRIVLSNFKTAAGVFEEDKYVPLIQGAVNLVISIVLVQKLGLVGIYWGTVISGLIANFVKPYIIYKKCFGISIREYYQDSAKYMTVTGVVLAIVLLATKVISVESWLQFALMVVIITVVYNGIFLAIFHRKEECTVVLEKVKQLLMSIKKKASAK